MPIMTSPFRQYGVTLIETLITMVIVSVGLLSIAALQLKSVQYASESYHRSVATVLAGDLVERLWAGICTLPDNAESVAEDWETSIIATDPTPLPGWVHQDGGPLSEIDGIYTINIEWTERLGSNDDQEIDGKTASFEHHAVLPTLPGCNP
ncbi:type IV pilus modification protein PilV [Thiocapsa roseopersicina]|uniref:Type IV pilus assembly protein PilV n=1 Tax=Thiocapsa roseopersicina TaxID=1058 RepID=A0A1H2Z3J2_THIRO|nr:type IV pilus modification protein PilV [Thiocapsa roseopersicina]SDX11980.1 type IV pilus assembly protein PilV [Thiocapsa roseopersicina]